MSTNHADNIVITVGACVNAYWIGLCVVKK